MAGLLQALLCRSFSGFLQSYIQLYSTLPPYWLTSGIADLTYMAQNHYGHSGTSARGLCVFDSLKRTLVMYCRRATTVHHILLCVWGLLLRAQFLVEPSHLVTKIMNKHSCGPPVYPQVLYLLITPAYQSMGSLPSPTTRLLLVVRLPKTLLCLVLLLV